VEVKQFNGRIFIHQQNYSKEILVTPSTTKVEFMTITLCACHVVWLRRILGQLGESNKECTVTLCDNSSSIKLSKNFVIHGRCKHRDVKYNFFHRYYKRMSCGINTL